MVTIANGAAGVRLVRISALVDTDQESVNQLVGGAIWELVVVVPNCMSIFSLLRVDG